MKYEFLNNTIDKESLILPESGKINSFLKNNHQAEIIKAIDFVASNESFLYIHGFMGTGKRQFINYICEFLNQEVIKLEYYCKEATVCDDILLSFMEIIDKLSISKAVNLNTKISTLNVKFSQQISSIKKPFLIILHSFDDISENNIELIKEIFSKIAKEENIKIIISTRAMKTDVLGAVEANRKIFLKALSKDLFKKYIEHNNISVSDKASEDFYKYTRGYYFYLALSIKIIQAMNVDLSDFLQKFNQSGMSFDSYLGVTYINLLPATIRNFFWFLRTIRHGISLNALASLELYDEFSIEYLKTNLMIFESEEIIYVQDYFLQKIDISIPEKTQIKLHKYIINIYEEQLKSPVKERIILISRQAMRAEIEYHNNCISAIKNGEKIIADEKENKIEKKPENIPSETSNKAFKISDKLNLAISLKNDKKITEAIEAFREIIDMEGIDLPSLVEARLNLAGLYKTVGDNQKACHYYELVEAYYKSHKEYINLNYLYYDLTDLYFKMYKNERAIETIKKVIYSVDTPQSLMVNASILLGNIYSEMNNSADAYTYYKKALESLDENIKDEVLSELYFKFALANDDKDDLQQAFEYYNKCIAISSNNSYKALAYSNLASCYLDNDSYDEAKACFKKAYEIEKDNNNFDGIYYNALNLAKIFFKEGSKQAQTYFKEAKKSAEFINEDFYILESTISLGDYYYNSKATHKEALTEYFKAFEIASRISKETDLIKIKRRIDDMKLRMDSKIFSEIESKYAK